MAEKEREQRFLDIYKSIDAKSSVIYEGKKFKKSDILSSARKLMFEGTALLTTSSLPSSSSGGGGAFGAGQGGANNSAGSQGSAGPLAGPVGAGLSGTLVTVVVLSDILFFLQENNQKYYFHAPESKVRIPSHTHGIIVLSCAVRYLLRKNQSIVRLTLFLSMTTISLSYPCSSQV